MTISFPRTIPSELRVTAMTLTLVPGQLLSPTRGGKQIAIDIRPALWVGEWETTVLTRQEWGAVQAWIDTLVAGPFYAYDPLHEYPAAYQSFAGLTVGGNPWDGNGQLSTVAANNVEITIEGLPVGFMLNPGDQFSFNYGAARALHRVVAGGTANSSGVLTVEVRPHVRPGWNAGTQVAFYRPSAKMLLEPGSYNERSEKQMFGRVSFRAIQTL